ncbi:hypothetical protein OK074_3245 [Actinobacteria bacterium OK074]|nr:hypothetical protein OK074_3245 [Actinobacteria bacterium OK074]
MAPFLAYEDKGPAAGAGSAAGEGSAAAEGYAALPLVLVHGHPFDHTMWAPQIAELSRTRRVIAPDLRGYGASPVVPGVTLLSDFAADVATLLDDLKVPEFALAGLSMGGQIVMDFYAQFPERVRALILADTFPRAETPEGVRTREAMAERLLAEGMTGYADEVLYKMVAPYAEPEVAAHVRKMMTATDPRGAAAALRGRAQRPDYSDLLTRVTVPTLVVVGRDDTFTPVSDAEAMHTALPNSTLSVIEGAAHLPNLERAGEFNGVLGAFLAELGL